MMRLYRHIIKKSNVRRLYAAALLLFLFIALGSRAIHHAHSHDDSRVTIPSVHSYQQHDMDCAPVVHCEHSHDSKFPGFQDQSSPYVLVPIDTLTIDRPAKTVVPAMEFVQSPIDLRSLSTPDPPPKNS
jgi:hypothetical protein